VKRLVGPVFWVESTLASLSGFLVLLTAVWHDWVEGIFGFDPDRHNGGFEWELAIACCVLTVLFGLLARSQWRQAPLAPSA
jgi:hypothetical protein